MSARRTATTAAEPVTLPIVGDDARFHVRRVYCVGRNYLDHIREMKEADERDPPFFFQKPTDAIVQNKAVVPYPAATGDFQFEVELVAAIGHGGTDISVESAESHIFGYAIGLDLTRRDLQATAKAKSLPWDSAKAFDQSAPVSALRRAAEIRHPRTARLTLSVNGELRQRADIADMLFTVPEIIHELSRLWTLVPGDLIFTGTPSGVAALQRGDRVRAELEGIAELDARIR